MRINHIDDVLPHIEGRDDFAIKRDDAEGYVSIDYKYAGKDTFDHPARRECRGIKFRSTSGEIMARPLHKFFNAGERTDEELDLSRPHVVTEKLDGSMIHPAAVNGLVRLMTRAGLTDVAVACEQRHLHQMAGWGRALAHVGFTPVFEWVSPHNRIVVPYHEDRLVLVALRKNECGTYMPFGAMTDWAQHHGFEVPRVLGTDAYGDWDGLARHCAGLEDTEGYVVWFTDGLEPQAVKVKAPWYVTRHRALDGLRTETHVVRLCLDGGVDDVLPMLGAGDRAKLVQFQEALFRCQRRWAGYIKALVNIGRRENRKEFALKTVPLAPPLLRGAMWAVYDGARPQDAVGEVLKHAARSGPRLAAALDQLEGPRWT